MNKSTKNKTKMTTSNLIKLLQEIEKTHGAIPVQFVVDNYIVTPKWCVAYVPGKSEEFEFVLNSAH